jgi:hypothetical protein
MLLFFKKSGGVVFLFRFSFLPFVYLFKHYLDHIITFVSNIHLNQYEALCKYELIDVYLNFGL